MLQFSPHPVLVSLWGIEQWTGLGVAPSVQQMTLGRPTLKPHLSNLAANYQIYHFLFGGFLRRRRSEAEEKIFCELTSEQTKGQAGSHNKRFLLWHFVNTGKWRKLFGNIICWWFENFQIWFTVPRILPSPSFYSPILRQISRFNETEKDSLINMIFKVSLRKQIQFFNFQHFLFEYLQLAWLPKISCIIFFWH